MSWELGAYEFDLYKPRRRAAAQLLLAAGPEELAAAARIEAKQHGANFRQVVGDALLKKNFPAIHAVGRASTRTPRLIELTWGKARDPLLCLVGQGMCSRPARACTSKLAIPTPRAGSSCVTRWPMPAKASLPWSLTWPR